MRGVELHPALGVLLAVLVVVGMVATCFLAAIGILLSVAALKDFVVALMLVWR